MAVALYLVYLLLPIGLLALGSVGEVWTNTLLPTGFTLRWFAEVAGDPSFRRAFVTSLLVALWTCVATAVLAVPLAYTLYHRAGQAGALAGRLLATLPVAVPALTLGFGYILVFSSDALPWLGSLLLLVAVAAGTNPPLFAGEVAVLISSAPEVQMAP
jgi:putative spermidine/putrescine transport system permease protein